LIKKFTLKEVKKKKVW